MKMPFERLMELVAALSPEDEQLPMGALAERWGEPATRIGDAIDALKVLRGEPSYISVRGAPADNGGGMAGCGPGGGVGLVTAIGSGGGATFRSCCGTMAGTGHRIGCLGWSGANGRSTTEMPQPVTGENSPG